MGPMSDAGSTPSDPAADPPSDPAADEARRKFREALDRKKFGHHGGGGTAGPQARAPHTSPAKPQRSFRRKSG
jgi:Family of unknown function (DUF5302)